MSIRQNPFQQLRFVCDGAESVFETICVELIRTEHANSKRVRVHKGDGGVDAAHGDWGTEGALNVFQIKYFPESLGESQRRQIRDSYRTARENPNFKLKSWILCLPTTLRQEDHTWFDNWKNDQDTHIDLWEGDKLESLLKLPAAADCRAKLTNLGAVGGPPPHAVLTPKLNIRCDAPQLRKCTLCILLANSGDEAAENTRVMIDHTRETHHVFNEAPRDWNHDNSPTLIPRTLSLKQTLNPGDSVNVLSVPLGLSAPPRARVSIRITSRTTQPRNWFAEVTEPDIIHDKLIAFVPDVCPWRLEPADKKTDDEPQSEFAKLLLEKMHANQDPNTRGLTTILVQVPGQIGKTMCYPTTLINGRHEQIVVDTHEYDQAIKELLGTGWLTDLGIGLSRHQYTLAKTRPGK
jgi:hypothetical protein